MSSSPPVQKSFGFKILEEEKIITSEEAHPKLAKPGLLSGLMTQR